MEGAPNGDGGWGVTFCWIGVFKPVKLVKGLLFTLPILPTEVLELVLFNRRFG